MEQPKITIWRAALDGGPPVKIAEGDAPKLSSRGQLAYIAEHAVWSVDGKGKPVKLFFDRGKDRDLQWSPDGGALAFVSNRDDHALIGLWRPNSKALAWLAPSTDRASFPRWSPDGKRIAFVRRPGEGGAPKPLLTQTPEPWSIWTADAATGEGHLVWQSPETLLGSYPGTEGQANLHWAADNRLVFLSDLDNWAHLYSVAADGNGKPLLLTPGSFMVENVVESRDGRFLIYSANTGATKDDGERRHIFRVPVGQAASVAVTSGEGIEIKPVLADDGHVAFIAADGKTPHSIGFAGTDGKGRRELATGGLPPDFPRDALTVPKAVSFKAADGLIIHGDLFDNGDSTIPKPAIIFVHGGPSRQMLLGWHYMDYYANGYAVNQYLAAHGFIVLSINYRLGIGYEHTFHYPPHAGPQGAAEYQDVQAGAKFLQAQKNVDGKRVGIWGGSYGGYLTGLALARNSDVFKAGVDLMGVHDMSRTLSEGFTQSASLGMQGGRYEKGDWEQALKVAFQSSPVADVARWKSPVLLIQGDDDRNVQFQQTVDLAVRLHAQHVPYEELVLPNEIHSFLRWSSWARADEATAAFLAKELQAGQN
jgi:dipeptidyl aminopeptidase/acylaminoacyl peptidase